MCVRVNMCTQSGLLKSAEVAAEIAAVVELYTGVKNVLPAAPPAAAAAGDAAAVEDYDANRPAKTVKKGEL